MVHIGIISFAFLFISASCTIAALYHAQGMPIWLSVRRFMMKQFSGPDIHLHCGCRSCFYRWSLLLLSVLACVSIVVTWLAFQLFKTGFFDHYSLFKPTPPPGSILWQNYNWDSSSAFWGHFWYWLFKPVGAQQEVCNARHCLQWVLWTLVYSCISLYTPVYPCILLYTLVYSCISLYSHVYPCILMYSLSSRDTQQIRQLQVQYLQGQRN